MISLYDQLKNQILTLPPGACIAVTDFRELATLKTVSKMLSRLSHTGTVEKVMRGVFWRPDGVHDHPEPAVLAEAIARENDWELAPSGETALYLFGLSDKKPKIWTFVTTGKYKSYECGGQVISFTHTTSSLWGTMSEKSRLLVQCMKAYGKESLSEERLRAIMAKMKDYDFHRLKEDTKTCSVWIIESISSRRGFSDKKESTEKG